MVTIVQAPPLPCYMVNNVTSNSLEQCKFIIDNDCLEEESIIDYVYLVYCDFGHELRYLSILLLIVLVIILFLALSAVADEFLCPSLLAVAKNLRMSDSLAGVTLLAFGNGCPDIFSSLAAASDDRSELIVGELLGAGIFCTSIVSGLIFIHSDFKLACRPILRDTSFYLLAVYLIWSFCWDGEITFYGSLAFILIYVIYLIVALGGQAIHSRLQGNYAIAEREAAKENEEKNINENDWFKWREESLRRKHELAQEKKDETMRITSNASKIQYNNGVTTIHLSSSNLNGSFESSFQQPNAHLTSSSGSVSSAIKLSSNGGYVNKTFISEMSLSSQSDLKYKANSQLNSSSQQHIFDRTKSSSQIQNHQEVILGNLMNGNSISTTTNMMRHKCDDLTMNEWDQFIAHINPIDLDGWREMSISCKIIGIIRAPLLFAALLTIPVVDSEKRINNWCRLLNSLHCITVPLALVLSSGFGSSESFSLFGLPLSVLILAPGVTIAAIVLKTSSSQMAPKFHPIFAYVGFAMSILWIYVLASEIIGLLKTVGIIFSMTDTAIGLGILAWGNSLGDIVANISLAEAGYPRMALGASIGAPLLNLLLGFGLAFTMSLKPGEFSNIEYSPTITLLCSTLAIILILLMISTLFPQHKSKKPFGYVLIGGYGVYFALAVCLEYGIIKF